MSRGAFKLVRTSGGITLFAAVEVSVEEATTRKLAVVADAIPEHHREAAIVGVRYAYDQWLRTHPTRSIQITVTKLRHTLVDTTHMAVLFAAYQATCIALAMAPDEKVALRDDLVFELAGR